MRLVDEEPFTPIVAVIEVDDTAAAIAEANRPDYGLVNYVCGADLRGALETAQALASGTVVVNGWRVVVPYAPYAGWRGSGSAPSSGGPGSRPSCTGSTCASWARSRRRGAPAGPRPAARSWAGRR